MVIELFVPVTGNARTTDPDTDLGDELAVVTGPALLTAEVDVDDSRDDEVVEAEVGVEDEVGELTTGPPLLRSLVVVAAIVVVVGAIVVVVVVVVGAIVVVVVVVVGAIVVVVGAIVVEDDAGCVGVGPDESTEDGVGSDEATDEDGCEDSGTDEEGCGTVGPFESTEDCVGVDGCEDSGTDDDGCEDSGTDDDGCEDSGTDEAGCSDSGWPSAGWWTAPVQPFADAVLFPVTIPRKPTSDMTEPINTRAPMRRFPLFTISSLDTGPLCDGWVQNPISLSDHLPRKPLTKPEHHDLSTPQLSTGIPELARPP